MLRLKQLGTPTRLTPFSPVITMGYTAAAGDLTVMIRRVYAGSSNISYTADVLPGWTRAAVLSTRQTDEFKVLEWTRQSFDGRMATGSDLAYLAVYEDAEVGGILYDSTIISDGDIPPNDPYNYSTQGTMVRYPSMQLTSARSAVIGFSELATGTQYTSPYRFGGNVTATNNGDSLSVDSFTMPGDLGIVAFIAPSENTPVIDVHIYQALIQSIPDPVYREVSFIEIRQSGGTTTNTGGGTTTNTGTGVNTGTLDGITPTEEMDGSEVSVQACGDIMKSVGGVSISTNDFVNAQELIKEAGSDDSDPLADEYEGYIANGKNDRGTTGMQDPLPTQTDLPDPSPVKPIEKDEKVKDTPAPPAQGCSSWSKGDYDAVMSSNFILRNFTVGYSNKAKNLERGCLYPNELIDLPGYDAQTRFCNLQALSQNVLEPIWAKFGSFRINSGIRNQNSVKSGVSQHVTGEAVDIQFPGWNYEMYWEYAKWIKDNVPFDQFIFEHSSRTGLAWYHLSFKRSGNRPASDRTKVMTMFRGKYDSGLRRYG